MGRVSRRRAGWRSCPTVGVRRGGIKGGEGDRRDPARAGWRSGRDHARRGCERDCGTAEVMRKKKL